VPRAIAHRVTVTTLDNAKKIQSFTVITPPLLLNRCEPIVLSAIQRRRMGQRQRLLQGNRSASLCDEFNQWLACRN
jgi:hypothetical protein